jgi:cytochrome c-type biogenesis protein CcmH
MRRLVHILLPMGDGGPARRSAKREGSGAGVEDRAVEPIRRRGRVFRAASRPSPCAQRSGLLRNPLRAALSQCERGLVVCAAVGLMAFAEPAAAPDQPLPDAAQEARAQALFEDIRCVVCQHESIADSPAGIAADMRRLVRGEVAAGRTDEEIEAGLVRRYGDYVLFRPPFRAGTLLLWLGPFLVVLIAGGVLLATLRRRPAEAAPLTAAEEAALAERLADRPDLDASSPHDHR